VNCGRSTTARYVHRNKQQRVRCREIDGAADSTRLRQPILVQLRDVRDDANAVRLDRFQLIDSGFG
jgi:hypothetical protein